MMKKKKKRVTHRTWTKNGITKKEHNGYIFIGIGRTWIGEHRLVVEDKIGRVLTSQEVVHHLDSNKENNQIGNLMIFKSQKLHQKFHLKLNQFGYTNPIKRQIENRWKEYE